MEITGSANGVTIIVSPGSSNYGGAIALFKDLTGIETSNMWKSCTNIHSSTITIFRSREHNYNRVGTLSLGQTTTKARYTTDSGTFYVELQDSTKNISEQNGKTDVFLWTGIRNPAAGCPSTSNFGW